MTLSVSMPNLSPEVSAAAASVMDVSFAGHQQEPLNYQGLTYTGFTVVNATQASVKGNIAYAAAAVSPKSLAVSSPYLHFALASLSIGCSNGTDGSNPHVNDDPNRPGSSMTLICKILVSGIYPSPSSSSSSATGSRTGTGTGTGPPPVKTLNSRMGVPLSTWTVWQEYASQWSGLSGLDFRATVMDRPVGVEIGGLEYVAVGSC